MGRKTSKKARSSSGASSGAYWLLVLVILGIIGWIGWETFQYYNPPQKAKNTRQSEIKKAIHSLKNSQPSLHTNANVNIPKEAVKTNMPSTNRIVTPPPKNPPPAVQGRPVQDMAEAQIALMRQGISCGSLDGTLNNQTQTALRVFQKKEGLPVTGQLDDATKDRLRTATPVLTNYIISAADRERLKPVPGTWLGKSQQSRLDYETVLELVAEKSCAHPDWIKKLNPGVNWPNPSSGTKIIIPDADFPKTEDDAAWVTIRISAKTLQVFDVKTNILAHFPCSVAQRLDKRLYGDFKIASIAKNPHYTFNPEVFPESDEGRKLGRKLVIPPGPNNPVGLVWIGLDKPGFGIHGTPKPEAIGKTESHGCFRLANWNALYLVQLVKTNMTVKVLP